MVKVFTNGPRDHSSIPGQLLRKNQKWYLMSPFLKLGIIRYGSRASGTIQGKESRPPRHLGVVAIEMRAFRSLSILIGQLIYIHT